MIFPSIKYQLELLLRDGPQELDLSDFPFGKVRQVLEEFGYDILDFDTDPGAGFYSGRICFKSGKDTGFLICGDFWDGTCKIVKNEIN